MTCRGAKALIPFIASITSPDGSYLDPAKRGLYADGRFASDREFTVASMPGVHGLEINAGPNYLPILTKATAQRGYRTEVDVILHRWFSPEEHGWYGGDNHVHAAHDQTGDVHSNVAYAALLARANGLSFVTQQSNDFPFEDHTKASTSDFIIRRSCENRQGSFSGHMNSPGVELPDADRVATMHAAMPAMAAVEWVHKHGGAIIHTHTMVPPTQLHWMGAAEAYSYAVLRGDVPDAMDLSGEASENLWFTVLNLGNKVSSSGSTDAALERANSPMPGDRRMYVQSSKFDYDEFVKGIRAGKTIATNAGPLFAFFEMDGKGVADTVTPGDHSLKIEVNSLYPLKDVQLINSGAVKKNYEVQGKSGRTLIEQNLHDDENGWYVVRTHDEKGNWAVTSPIYVRAVVQKPKPFAASMIFEIGNFSRLAEVRKNFMAHFISTVSPDDPLRKVELLKDDLVVRSWSAADGDRVVENKTPVTETFGDYHPGWLWYPNPGNAVRFQADWDVSVSGWYVVRSTTRSGRVITSDAMHYDAASTVSNQTSVANVFSQGLAVRHWGYGEDINLDKIDNGDHWWYFKNQYWSMSTQFGDTKWHQVEGDKSREGKAFRIGGGVK